MDDDRFLIESRKMPRPEFAQKLYHNIQLTGQSRLNLKRNFVRALALAALALALFLAFSPPARTLAQAWITQIGKLFITDAPTYAEQFEETLGKATPAAASSEPLEWQVPPLLSLEEASVQAGFTVANPERLPDQLQIISRAVAQPTATDTFTRVTTVWQSEAYSLVLSQTLYQADASPQTLPVGEARIAQVSVRGKGGVWIEKLRLSTFVDENNQVAPEYANLLVWDENGVEYWLQSTPGLTQTEMISIADSLKP